MPKNKGDYEFAQFLVNSYLGKKYNEDDVDDSVYYRAGARSESANMINKNLDEFFENEPKWSEEERFKIEKISSVKHDQVIFYGSMYKVLKLAFPFYLIPGKIMHFCKKKVPCFEPMTPQQRKQVHIVKYSGEEDFFLRIDTERKGEQLFVLMTKSKKTMEEVFQMIKNSSEDLESITKNDVFKIPQLNIKATHVTSELNNAILRFKDENKKYFIAQIIESVNFRIEGVLEKDNFNKLTMMVPETEAPKLKARRMCLNNPFWVVLRYKGCHPFFALYVNAATDI